MRIAVISDAVLPTPYDYGHGLGRMAHQVATGLLKRGHNVTLFARTDSRFDGTLITPSDAYGYDGEAALARAALEQHLCSPFDVFVDHSHIHRLSEIMPELPVVNVFHDIYQAHRHNAVVVSYAQKLMMNIPDAIVVHNAVPDPALFEEPDDYAVIVGALTPIKKPLLAIEACARFGIRLIIVGHSEGDRFPWEATGSCEYLGPLPHARALQMIARARLLFQLGATESFGLTALEAILCGVPVVAWPSGGSLDIIDQGVTGAFVPVQGRDVVASVNDAMRLALTLDRHRVRQVALTKFSVDEQITRYEALCARCARGEFW